VFILEAKWRADRGKGLGLDDRILAAVTSTGIREFGLGAFSAGAVGGVGSSGEISEGVLAGVTEIEGILLVSELGVRTGRIARRYWRV
jgi:hypothetical protein